MKMTATVFVQKAVQETILHIMENKQSCEVGSQDKIDKTVPNSCYLKPTLKVIYITANLSIKAWTECTNFVVL